MVCPKGLVLVPKLNYINLNLLISYIKAGVRGLVKVYSKGLR